MIFIVLIGVIITGGSSEQLGEPETCDSSQLRTCIASVPRTRIGLPRNTAELDTHCAAYNKGMSCFDSWTKRCLPNDGQKVMEQQIKSARVIMHFLCNDTAIRREYLKEPSCLDRVSPNWSRCVKEMDADVKEINKRSQQQVYSYWNTEICCAKDSFLKCVADAGRFCSISASTLLNRIAWVLSQDMIDCNQQTRAHCAAPPPPAAVPLLISLSLVMFFPQFL